MSHGSWQRRGFAEANVDREDIMADQTNTDIPKENSDQPKKKIAPPAPRGTHNPSALLTDPGWPAALKKQFNAAFSKMLLPQHLLD